MPVRAQLLKGLVGINHLLHDKERKAGGSQETDGKEDKQTETKTETKGGGGMADRRPWVGSPGELFCSSQAQVSRIIIKICGA